MQFLAMLVAALGMLMALSCSTKDKTSTPAYPVSGQKTGPHGLELTSGSSAGPYNPAFAGSAAYDSRFYTASGYGASVGYSGHIYSGSFPAHIYSGGGMGGGTTSTSGATSGCDASSVRATLISAIKSLGGSMQEAYATGFDRALDTLQSDYPDACFIYQLINCLIQEVAANPDRYTQSDATATETSYPGFDECTAAVGG